MSSSAKLSARDRIFTLLDDNSFVETGALVTKRNTDFNLQTKEAPSDGVITGYGIIDGNPVCVYSQDVTALNGTIGEMHAKKIANLYDMAMKISAPVIGLIDCAGLRLQEASDALAGLGEIYYRQSMASGVIPQIAAIFGNCGGGLAVAASLCDFVFAEKKSGKLFINHPNAVEGNNINKCDTASADFKAETGAVDFVSEDEVSMLNDIRSLISAVMSTEAGVDEDGSDDLNRLVPEVENGLDDVTAAIKAVSDGNFFIEVKKQYAKEMVTGFIKLNGVTVGVAANRTCINDDKGKAVEKFGSALTAGGCYKAEKLINFCDAFEIPVLTLTNVDGYGASMFQEKGLAVAAAKLTYAYADATVPKITLITKKALGSSYITMGSKSLGADIVFALEGAEIGTMDAKLAAQIIYEDEIKSAKDSKAELDKKTDEYRNQCQTSATAAKRGYIDSIIAPAEARKNLIYAFEMLYIKREDRPAKKHGTV